jgi:NADP-dependent 3-hydroxy acid dehydrogenase YdfG
MMRLGRDMAGRRFDSRVVFITGASSGIGAALARAFAREGARVVLAARRIERLKALAAELKISGAEAIWQVADVTQREDLDRAVAATLQNFGQLDIAIANAGFGVAGPVQKLSADDYRRQFDTNVFGVLNTVWATLPALEQSRGRLVLIGSVAGHVALPRNSAYSMSKFAVRALAGALAGELRPSGVSVTLISPGFLSTEIRKVDNRGGLREQARDPIPNWLRMDPERAASLMLTAIDHRQRELIVTGHGKLAVFLSRFAPGLVAAVTKRGLRGRSEPSG